MVFVLEAFFIVALILTCHLCDYKSLSCCVIEGMNTKIACVSFFTIFISFFAIDKFNSTLCLSALKVC